MPAPAASPAPSTPDPTRRLALRVMVMPRDTNSYGTIFGGVILSYIDQAAYVEALSHGRHRWVTASIDRVDFKAPVLVGDIVNLYTATTRKGTTSVTVKCEVEAERAGTGQTVQVTSATIAMVAVDPAGRPIPFTSHPTADLPGRQWADPQAGR